MDIELPARDGVLLAATLFEPARPNGSALLLNGGTGIPRQFYGAFARHLAERGFVVLTYDYRGIGQSEAPSSATMEQWGSVDQASMIDHLVRLRPGASLGLIGHSLGGQILGLADNIGRVRAAVLVCSQSGHWRHWPRGRRRLRMLALWWLLIPGLTALAGRFPGSWIGTSPALRRSIFFASTSTQSTSLPASPTTSRSEAPKAPWVSDPGCRTHRSGSLLMTWAL